MLVAPLSVNSSETKEGKQKLIFNKLYKLKKNNNNNNKKKTVECCPDLVNILKLRWKGMSVAKF